MTLDVRSLGEWVKDIFGRGRLSGGGELGATSLDLEQAEPPVDADSGSGSGRQSE